MATRKRTKIEREKNYEQISEWYLKGWSQRRIAERLRLNQSQICNDLKVIQKRWKESTNLHIDEQKKEQLVKIDHLEKIYWQAYEKSLHKFKSVSTKSSISDEPVPEMGTGDRPVASLPSEKTIRIETRNGDPRYLQGVEWCIEQRCKILNLYPDIKQKIEHTGKDGDSLEFGMSKEELLEFIRKNVYGLEFSTD